MMKQNIKHCILFSLSLKFKLLYPMNSIVFELKFTDFDPFPDDSFLSTVNAGTFEIDVIHFSRAQNVPRKASRVKQRCTGDQLHKT